MSKLKSSMGMVLAVGLACVVGGNGWTAENTQRAGDATSERREKLEAAQSRLEAAAREIADLSLSMSAAAGVSANGRAILGINIGSLDGKERTEGVEVISVSPGGPASQAGLQAGDVIVEIAGKPLKDDDEGPPLAKLKHAMLAVEPNETVTLKYQRAGKVQTARVTPRRIENHLFMAPRMPMAVAGSAGVPGIAFTRAMGVFGNAELVSLTPKLGRYFGTEQGLLVVRAPDDSRLKLEDGDVIVDIDGRVPSSASHAMRILASYQTGETLKLNVLRMKKRTSFEVTIPEGQEGFPMPEAGAFGVTGAHGFAMPETRSPQLHLPASD